VEQWDLGEQWCHWAKLPFVFAMWVARANVDVDCLVAPLQRARDEGERHLAEISERHAAFAGMTHKACLSYLRDNLHFRLGALERQGLERFRQLAAEIGYVGPSLCR
jgi:chorismate dehydratase